MDQYSELVNVFENTEINAFVSSLEGNPISVVGTDEEFSLVAKVKLHPEIISEIEKIKKLRADFYLEALSPDSELTFSDEIELKPDKDEYDFEVSIKHGKLSEGLYKVTVVISGKYIEDARLPLVAFAETNLIQIYDPYLK